jgi:Uma2 family endonuclease
MATATKSRLRLGPELNGTLMTPEEFDGVQEYDENWRYELVHGVLVVNPIPLEAQAGPNDYLGYLLLSYQHEHPQGTALDATLPERYIRTLDSRRLADRVIWAGLGRRPDPRRDLATIAVEFVSAGKRNRRRDYEEKRKEYLESGVKEYWLFDRFERILTVFRRRQKKIIREGEIFRTPLLPGFELRVADVLAVADRWERRGEDTE